jgi:5-formyltetrahydrofolate cyclo-ligase
VITSLALKRTLRVELKKRREVLSFDRRAQASEDAFESLTRLAYAHNYIISYSSFGDELCLTGFNRYLEKEGKLVLPTINGSELKLYHVKNMATQLHSHPFGFLEPNPALCVEANLNEMSLILVPGLAFDRMGHRIGYGAGYYDKLLDQLRHSIFALGVGYREQFHKENLPISNNDVSLTALLLF